MMHFCRHKAFYQSTPIRKHKRRSRSDNPDDWNKLINWVISEIRMLEPKCTIIMGSNKWQTVGTFKDLKVPQDDENIILSVHYDEPLLLTHYRASWTNIKDLTVAINYPGRMADTTLYVTLGEQELNLVKARNGYHDGSTLDKSNNIILLPFLMHRDCI